MTTYEIVRLLVYLIGLPIIALLVLRIRRRIQAIRRLDEELRAEEAQNPANPYAQLAKMYEAQQVLSGGSELSPLEEKLENWEQSVKQRLGRRSR